MTQNSGIYVVDESAVMAGPRVLARLHWPLAGISLSDAWRTAHNLPTLEQEQDYQRREQLRLKQSNGLLKDNETRELNELETREDIRPPVKAIRIPNTHHDYTVVRNHLVPYYPPKKESLDHHKEAQIIARSRTWIINAMPQLSVPWTKEGIDYKISEFNEKMSQLDPSNFNELNERSADFRLIVGAIMTRFEFLGRAITQRNTYGTEGVIPKPTDDDRASPLLPMSIQPPSDAQPIENTELSNDQINVLQKEYTQYWRFLSNPNIEPFLRLVLLTDMRIDRDGILIDYLREIGKPIRVREDKQARHIDNLIIDKLGSAMQSIDQTHAVLKKAMTTGETAKIFDEAAHDFLLSEGAHYGVHSVQDIVNMLDDYSALCKLRVGIKGEDHTGYGETYAKVSALETFFNGPSGLLQSIKRDSHGRSKDVAALREILTRGTKLMMRTAYTRIPANADAPSVWIPNLDKDAPPLEHHLIQFLTKEERIEAKKIQDAAKAIGGSDAERYLNQAFSSVGCLERSLKQLEASIAKSNEKNLNGKDGGRTGRH